MSLLPQLLGGLRTTAPPFPGRGFRKAVMATPFLLIASTCRGRALMVPTSSVGRGAGWSRRPRCRRLGGRGQGRAAPPRAGLGQLPAPAHYPPAPAGRNTTLLRRRSAHARPSAPAAGHGVPQRVRSGAAVLSGGEAGGDRPFALWWAHAAGGTRLGSPHASPVAPPRLLGRVTGNLEAFGGGGAALSEGRLGGGSGAAVS